MTMLIGVFGFLALLSAVALVQYEGNPLFIFSLALCAASLIWLVRLEREDSGGRSRSRLRR